MVALLSGSLHAHGGLYRGPIVPPPGGAIPTPGVPGTPGTGGVPGPSTGSRGAARPGSWEVWWELNKGPLLQLRQALSSAAAADPNKPQSGEGSGDSLPDRGANHRATDRDRANRIRPVLAGLLAGERNKDVITAALVGLARLGPLDGLADADKEIDVLPLLRAQLKRGDQEIRETAALSLGILGHPDAQKDLAALLRDRPEGRRLMNRESVDDRTRAFSAYGLGLLAREQDDPASRVAAHESLKAVLFQRNENDRDIRVAVQTALGILVPHHLDGGVDRRLRWMLVEDLWRFFELDLGRGDAPIQCHALTAIGRLLGRGATGEHERTVRRLTALLKDRTQANAVHQSAAQTLGIITPDPGTYEWAAIATDELAVYYRRGVDQIARNFSVLALGRIGGAKAGEFLISTLPRSTKGRDRPWVGLALGLWARGQRLTAGKAAMPEEVTQAGKVLVRTLKATSTPTAQDALAIAIGLAGYRDAVPEVRQLFLKRTSFNLPRGHFATALGLLGDESSAEAMRGRLRDSVLVPATLLRTAVGLGLLGDPEAPLTLMDILQGKSRSTAVLGAAAGGLLYVGDRRVIDPLIVAVGKKDLTNLGRAFLAAALGGIGDRSDLPWNTCLTVDANYAARVSTLINGASGVLDLL